MIREQRWKNFFSNLLISSGISFVVVGFSALIGVEKNTALILGVGLFINFYCCLWIIDEIRETKE